MSTTKRRLSLLLKVAVLVLVIFLGMAVQTADADAASYEAVKVSDLKIGSDDAVKTKLKSGGYIWVDRDFNGADHHDVYFQKEKGGDMYLILDYFDTETAELKNTEMYMEGFQAKLKKDTSYKGLWAVSFTLQEF